MNTEHRKFLLDAAAGAGKAGHIFPEMAACEAALECSYGASELARVDNNLFGTKQHRHPVYLTHNLPTREFEKGVWEVVDAAWIHYPDWASCFADRMSTLRRLSTAFPHYAAALAAKDAHTYVVQVSESWSTDPGWVCTCGAMFGLESVGKEHLQMATLHRQLALGETPTLKTVPGLGRALKVQAIYDSCTGDWNATA